MGVGQVAPYADVAVANIPNLNDGVDVVVLGLTTENDNGGEQKILGALSISEARSLAITLLQAANPEGMERLMADLFGKGHGGRP
jgi:hypothetical protein